MRISSITTGEEFLCLDKTTFRKIIGKIHKKHAKGSFSVPDFEQNKYLVFNRDFKKITNIQRESRKHFDNFVKNLKSWEIEQIVPSSSTWQKFLTLEKLEKWHSKKYIYVNKNDLVIEVKRHPEKNNKFKKQIWLYKNKELKLILIDSWNLSVNAKTTGETKAKINWKRVEPPLKALFNKELEKYYWEKGKELFWEKISLHDSGRLPSITSDIRESLKNQWVSYFPQDDLEWIKIDYLVKIQETFWDYLVEVWKIEFGLSTQ